MRNEGRFELQAPEKTILYHDQKRWLPPGITLHADHLEQPAALGLREAGHRGRDARAVYNAFGRRGLCFTDTDLITTRLGRRGSRGGLARFKKRRTKAGRLVAATCNFANAFPRRSNGGF